MFDDQENYPKGWHLINDATGVQGEHTLCGNAFDGDANSSKVEPEYKYTGKITCPTCIAIIKLCKSINL